MRIPLAVTVAALVVSLHIAAAPGSGEDAIAYGTRFPVPGRPGALMVTGAGTPPAAAIETFRELSGAGETRRAIVFLGPGAARPQTPEWARTLAPARTLRFDSGDLDAPGSPGLRDADPVWLVIEDGGGIPVGSVASLLPGCVVSTGAAADRAPPPPEGYVGLSIGPGTALAVRGRRGHVLGAGPVRVTLAASSDRPIRRQSISSGRMIDLVALSRAAVARAGETFPGPAGDTPEVEGGTLFIGGGGRTGAGTLRRFIDAAGGPEALIVVIPTALGAPDPLRAGQGDVERLRRAGARRVRVLHADTPQEAEAAPFLETLRQAGGVLFSGGRQWRLVDSYLDTRAHEAMRAMLRRGGAVFGASAGASIQAGYMVRGHPLGNTVMMAEGYERGLGFLPGVAIDQHFAQRHRFPDMAGLKRVFPQLVGIGIDEGTALIVEGHVLEVVGENGVAVYDRPGPAGSRPTEYRLLGSGERYDLLARQVIERDGE